MIIEELTAIIGIKTRGLNNGIFQNDGDFPNFFKKRIAILVDKSNMKQLKSL